MVELLIQKKYVQNRGIIMDNLKGKIVKEAEATYIDGVETIVITFVDGIQLNVYPSIGHNLSYYTKNLNSTPWWEKK